MIHFLKHHWHRIGALALMTIPRVASAEGGGVLGDPGEIGIGGGGGDIKETIISIIQKVLSYVAVIAVAMIVIAGIWLIVGAASDSSRDKAKKIIIYTCVGLLVILLAEAIVQFVIDAVGAE